MNPEWVEAVCAARFPAWNDMDPMSKKGARRQAEFWLETTEPLIRADERNLTWLAALMEGYAKDAAHAEAVAARLVAVICEQESLIVWNIRWREQAEADRAHLRAQIAADIEERGAEGFVTTEGAARIARGES